MYNKKIEYKNLLHIQYKTFNTMDINSKTVREQSKQNNVKYQTVEEKKEAVKNNMKRYYEKNKEKLIEKQKEYNKKRIEENKIKLMEYERMIQAQKN